MTSIIHAEPQAKAVTLPSWQTFLEVWKSAGSHSYLRDGTGGFYLGVLPVACCNTAKIDRASLPPHVEDLLPKKESEASHMGALVSPCWTRDRGVVIDVRYSCYSNGWSVMSVATYIPLEDRWVCPTEVHSYGYPQS